MEEKESGGEGKASVGGKFNFGRSGEKCEEEGEVVWHILLSCKLEKESSCPSFSSSSFRQASLSWNSPPSFPSCCRCQPLLLTR